jgi:hypothetical protein
LPDPGLSPSQRMERTVTKIEPPSEVGSGQWGLVAVAWLLVGVPLLWGVWNTLLKAAALFR